MEVPVQSRGPSRHGERPHPSTDVTSRTVGSRGEATVRPTTGSLRHVGSEGGLSRMVRTPMSPSGGMGEDVFAVLCSPTNVAPIVEANLDSIFPSSEPPTPPPAADTQSHSRQPQVKPPRPQKPKSTTSTTTTVRKVVKAPVKAIPRQPSKQPSRQPQKASIPLFAPTSTSSHPVKQQLPSGARKPPSVPTSQFKRGQKRSKSLERAATAQRAALDEKVEAVEPDEIEAREDIESREERHREGILVLVQHDLATTMIPKMMRAMVTRLEPRARQAIELEELEERASTLHRCHTFGIISVQAAEQHLSTHYDTLIDHTINTATMGGTAAERRIAHNVFSGDVEEVQPLQLVVAASQWGPSYTTVYGEPSVDKVVEKEDTRPVSDDDDDDAPAPPPRRTMAGKGGGIYNDRLFMDLDSVRLAFERTPMTSFAVAEVAQSTPSRFKLPILPSVAAPSTDNVVASRPPTEPSPPPRGSSTSTRTLPSYLPSIPVTPSTAKLFPSNPPPKPEPTVSLPSLLARSAHEHKRIRAAFAEEGSSRKGAALKYDYTVTTSPRKQPAGGAHNSRSYESRLQAALEKLNVAGTTTMEPSTAGYVSLVRSTPLCDEEALQRKILDRRVEPKERKRLCDEIGRQMRLAVEEDALRRNRDRHVLHCDELRFHSRRTISEMAVVALFRDVIHKQLEERDELVRMLVEREQEMQWRVISNRFAAGLASVQRMKILQGEEPLMRARVEWAWGAEWCPPDVNTTPCPTAVHHVFSHSAEEARFRGMRHAGDTTTQPLPPLGMPFATFLVMQEKDQRRILELFQLQSYRINLLAYHVNIMVPMSRMPNAICQNAAARTVQRKFRAIRMGLSGWRHTHRQLGGIIRIQRLQKERTRAKQQTALILQQAISTS